ncbi:MAG: NUDIX domain-containing protein [Terricaulis sp.]
MSENGLKLRQKVRALITDASGDVLLIRPHGYGCDEWALAGGGVEQGETPEDAMRRELAEELGIDRPAALRRLAVTNRFLYAGDYKAKRGLDHDGQSAVMFVCDVLTRPTLRLQSEEIADARWFHPDDAARAFPVEAQQTIFMACIREVRDTSAALSAVR